MTPHEQETEVVAPPGRGHHHPHRLHDRRQHHSLATIGEECVHLICEFVRADGPYEHPSFRGVAVLFGGATMLSRLSRTCRFMYIAVRNLPSVTTLLEPEFSKYPLPRGEAALDVAYWSDLAGLVWYVKDSSQLLELATMCAEDERGDESPTYETQQTRVAQVRKLFITISWGSVLFAETDGKVRAAIQPVFRHVGGLFLFFMDTLGLDVATLPEHLSSDSDGLRYFGVTFFLQEPDSTSRCMDVMRKFTGNIERVCYTSACLIDDCTGPSEIDLGAFSGVKHITVAGLMQVRNLEPLKRSARYVDMSVRHDVVASSLPDLCPLGNVHTVTVTGNQRVTDVGMLAGVHSLSLCSCAAVTNLSALNQVHSLFVQSYHPLTSANGLGHLHELELNNTQDLTDVSALGGLHTIDLTGCDSLTDVSSLGCVHTLALYRCMSVSDVSALGGVHRLSISFCDNVTDVSALGTVHTLTLVGSAVIDVSALGGVHELTLDLEHLGADVSALGGVHKLTINNGDQVSDISFLKRVHTLTLGGMDLVTDVSSLGSVHTLTLSKLPNVSDVSALGGVHNLSLFCCDAVTDVGALGLVHMLQLNDCSELSDVGALGTVHTLVLKECPRVSDVSALGKVHSLGICDCNRVTDLSKLQHVHTLTLGGHFTDSILSALDGVQRLRLDDCKNVTAFGSLTEKVHFLVDM